MTDNQGIINAVKQELENHKQEIKAELKRAEYASLGPLGITIFLFGIGLLFQRFLKADYSDVIFFCLMGCTLLYIQYRFQRRNPHVVNENELQNPEEDDIRERLDDLLSIDIVLDESRRQIDFQFGQYDGIVTKSGIILGISGVIFTVILTYILANIETPPSHIIIVKYSLVPIFISILLSFIPIAILKWQRPPRVDALRDSYIIEDERYTKIFVIDELLTAISTNDKSLAFLFRLLKISYLSLFLGFVLLAVWIAIILI